MTYAAKVLADSISFGVRLTTMEVTFPRFILAEFNTHRMFSRNSASSRAIPVEKRIAQVRENPFVPEAFTKNQKGMQANENVGEGTHVEAHQTWLEAAEAAARFAEHLAEIGVHKQHANRILEPYVWHTVVVSATEWANFFALRTDKAAQPEMQITAKLMRDARETSTPRPCKMGEWHLPYVEASDVEMVHAWAGAAGDCHPERLLLAMSVVRCAAVSYERQYADRTFAEYIKRHDDLAASGHWSPFEHQAEVAPIGSNDWFGNFRAPWQQYRKTFRNEAEFAPKE